VRSARGSRKPIRAIAIERIDLTTRGGADEAHDRRARRFHVHANKSDAQVSRIWIHQGCRHKGL
jgi:hypothetical protein